VGEVAIEVSGISKAFRRDRFHGDGRVSEAIYAVSRAMWAVVRQGRLRPPRAAGSASAENSPWFWALQDVSFTVSCGETVALMGRNGAGKSTLLKILARIVAPSQGRFGIRGRASCLLEVGTGFHPELTGRENIFLSGRIRGLSRPEILEVFDTIVAFSEIGNFLDVPVKRYSSGMYVRLGFAAAAHFASEVLVLDEVLSVGDAPFQEKCNRKMRELTSAGRTVLIVSHSLPAVRAFCSRGIVLSQGRLQYDGPINQAIDVYQARFCH
jgi:lipopolysaccharide transport system ATP-binding protein